MAYDKNSGRYSRVATVFAFINILILLTVLAILVGIWILVQRNQTLPPLNAFAAENPQVVENKIVSADGVVRVTATKCNLTDHALSINGVSYLVQETPLRARWLRAKSEGTVWEPGCKTSLFENDLHLGLAEGVVLEPGTYHLEGTHTVIVGTQRQIVPWYTESFTVVKELAP